MTKIVIFKKYTPQSIALLKSLDDVSLIEYESDSQLKELIKTANILLIRSTTEIHKKLIDEAVNLKLIITATSGFDHIDLKACEELNIQVAHTPTSNVESAAELTFGHILNLVRKLNIVKNDSIKSDWKTPQFFSSELSGKNLGIVGLGRIGSRVAKIGAAFSMNILAHDPYQPEEQFKDCQAQCLGFLELIRQADILSFHVPLTDETYEMLNARTLCEASSNLVVINTSRGKVIREPDLIIYLKTQKIHAAGLDVFHKEPLHKDSELLSLKNVFLTPHIGAYTQEAYLKSSYEAALKAKQYILKDELTDLLPPRAKWAQNMI